MRANHDDSDPGGIARHSVLRLVARRSNGKRSVLGDFKSPNEPNPRGSGFHENPINPTSATIKMMDSTRFSDDRTKPTREPSRDRKAIRIMSARRESIMLGGRPRSRVAAGERSHGKSQGKLKDTWRIPKGDARKGLVLHRAFVKTRLNRDVDRGFKDQPLEVAVFAFPDPRRVCATPRRNGAPGPLALCFRQLIQPALEPPLSRE